MNIILYIAAFAFVISAILFFAGFPGKRKYALILMLISAVLIVYALSRTGETSKPTLSVSTTIGQFSDEIKAAAEKTPTALVYTESIGSPETFSTTVEDPAIVKKALDIILNTSVSRRGCQVDMYQLQYEEYRFVFGEETYTLSFIPNSYFCYDSNDYELGENQLANLRNFLHEMTAEEEPVMEPRLKWYSDEAELRTTFMDNGDEARSVTELTLSADGECLTGFIEGAYDVISIDKQPDCYVITYTYGDFYSHDTIRSSCITVENGEMIITDIEQ